MQYSNTFLLLGRDRCQILKDSRKQIKIDCRPPNAYCMENIPHARIRCLGSGPQGLQEEGIPPVENLSWHQRGWIAETSACNFPIIVNKPAFFSSAWLYQCRANRTLRGICYSYFVHYQLFSGNSFTCRKHCCLYSLDLVLLKYFENVKLFFITSLTQNKKLKGCIPQNYQANTVTKTPGYFWVHYAQMLFLSSISSAYMCQQRL